MKRKIIGLSLVAMLVFSMTACGSGEESEESKEPEEIVYVDESEIEDVFASPEEYVGKYIKLIGNVYGGPDKGENGYYYQAWNDVENVDRDFMVQTKEKVEGVEPQGYIQVDGKIVEDFGGEEVIDSLLIEAVDLQPLTYVDAMVPTLKEIAPQGAAITQNNVTVQVDKVQYAETETRVFVTIANASDATFSPYSSLSKLVVNGQQLEISTDSMTNYYAPELGEVPYEVLPQITASGLLVFPAIDQNTSFQFYMEGMSDNWELEFQPFNIIIPAQ